MLQLIDQSTPVHRYRCTTCHFVGITDFSHAAEDTFWVPLTGGPTPGKWVRHAECDPDAVTRVREAAEARAAAQAEAEAERDAQVAAEKRAEVSLKDENAALRARLAALEARSTMPAPVVEAAPVARVARKAKAEATAS